MIKVTGLKKHFGDLEVLKGIDQHIKQGEKVVVKAKAVILATGA